MFVMSQFIQFLIFSFFSVLSKVDGHGYLLEPPGRSSIWRIPEFAARHPPVNYDDNALYCGGYSTQHDLNRGKCGVCGDSYSDPHPRDNEEGGKFYSGIIVRGYKAGQVMPVEVQLTQTHYGHFEFRLCARSDNASHIDQTCFDEHLLERTNNGTGTKYYIKQQSGTHYASYDLLLPPKVTCSHCVLQWHYRTGNRWGICENGKGALGCGPQEWFRGCADIIILP